MSEAIRDKKRMYELLSAGRLGNTAPVFYSLAEWGQRPPQLHVPLWGVRSHMSGDPRAKLDVPTAEVPAVVSRFGDDRCNITPMVDDWLVWRGEVIDGPEGLECFGAFGLKHLKWRPVMLNHAKRTTGVAATHLLRSVLNENSYDDLMALMLVYPGHVFEFTALSRCYGTLSHRNAVNWEVRCGESGEYELSTWRRYL